MYNGARVLVAGGTGTIGVPVVRQLLKRGAKVTIVSLDDKSRAENIFGHRFNEIDFTNIMNIQQGTQSQQLKRGSMPYIPVSQICNPKTDVFIGEVRDLRE